MSGGADRFYRCAVVIFGILRVALSPRRSTAFFQPSAQKPPWQSSWKPSDRQSNNLRHDVPQSQDDQPYQAGKYRHPFIDELPPNDSCQFSGIPELFQDLHMPQPPRFPPFVPHRDPRRRLRPTYALIVSYHGPSFPGGYECNPTITAPTVRGVLTDAVSKCLRYQGIIEAETIVRLNVAGRTDAGVSAKANVLSFSLSAKSTATPDLDRLVADVNRLLRDGSSETHEANEVNEVNETDATRDGMKEAWDALQLSDRTSTTPFMKIHDGYHVSSSFHPTFQATAREYIYILPLRKTVCLQYARLMVKTVNQFFASVMNQSMDYTSLSKGRILTQSADCTIQAGRCWLVTGSGRVDVEDVDEVSNDQQQLRTSGIAELEDAIPGFNKVWRKHEQEGSTSSSSSPSSAVVSVGAAVGPEYDGALVFQIRANRFLKRMIRKMVNSLLLDASATIEEPQGNDEQPNRWIRRIERMDRSYNCAAPPGGLCLWRIYFEE